MLMIGTTGFMWSFFFSPFFDLRWLATAAAVANSSNWTVVASAGALFWFRVLWYPILPYSCRHGIALSRNWLKLLRMPNHPVQWQREREKLVDSLASPVSQDETSILNWTHTCCRPLNWNSIVSGQTIPWTMVSRLRWTVMFSDRRPIYRPRELDKPVSVSR